MVTKGIDALLPGIFEWVLESERKNERMDKDKKISYMQMIRLCVTTTKQ